MWKGFTLSWVIKMSCIRGQAIYHQGGKFLVQMQYPFTSRKNCQASYEHYRTFLSFKSKFSSTHHFKVHKCGICQSLWSCKLTVKLYGVWRPTCRGEGVVGGGGLKMVRSLEVFSFNRHCIWIKKKSNQYENNNICRSESFQVHTLHHMVQTGEKHFSV